MALNYSKWDHIEVSDDEDDTHPNIDTASLFKWRHEARIQRMAEKKLKQEEVEKGKKTISQKMKELEEKFAAASTDDDKRKVQEEMNTIKADEERYRKLEAEIAEAEKNEAWNVDTIGKVTSSTTRINKISDKKPEPKKISEEEDGEKMSAFFNDHETEIETYGRLHGMKPSENYLLDHPHLVSEYTSSYLTLTALNLAIEGGEAKLKEMEIMAEQCILMQYLCELAKSLHLEGTNTGVIKNFFTKLGKADPGYMKHYHQDVEDFKIRIMKRAKEKIAAATAQDEEAKQARVASAPGGLDPQEVFESLPEEMQACFEAQDIPGLYKLADSMDKEVFMYHFDRCIKSGLWVPDKNAAGEGGEKKEEGAAESSGTSGSAE